MNVDFLVTAFVVTASPGTGVLFTLAVGLSHGARASLIAALAGTLGIIPHLAAAMTGLAALLATSAAAFTILKFAGAAYLLYLAWCTWKNGFDIRPNDMPPPMGIGRMLVSGILMNLLNPKLSLFFLIFLPPFVHTGGSDPIRQMLILSLTFMAMTFVVFAAYGVFAAKLRRHVVKHPSSLKWLKRGFVLGFLSMGAKLAVAQR